MMTGRHETSAPTHVLSDIDDYHRLQLTRSVQTTSHLQTPLLANVDLAAVVARGFKSVALREERGMDNPDGPLGCWTVVHYGRRKKKKKWSCSGSNRGPSACKADVMTTTPQDHRQTTILKRST